MGRLTSRVGLLGVAAGVALVAAALSAGAATLVVDAGAGTPFATIQAAIDAATPGQDDVFVRCGVYVENVVMRDDVPLRGQSPECTIIDGGQQGVTVDFLELGPGARLEGFTVRNGLDFGQGGGIRIRGGSPVITRNVITDNVAGFGAGVHVSGTKVAAAPVISYNIIRDNTASYWGGGALFYYTAGARLVSNLIVGNASGEYGGGVFARGFGATGSIVGNTIVGNTARYGAGIIAYDSTFTITDNVVTNNDAMGAGGGIAGFFISCYGPHMEHNDVFGNAPDNYLCGDGGGDPTGTRGNISADPRFVDPHAGRAFGFQPRSDSPLIDAGSAGSAVSSDLRGIPRPVDGDADGSASVDIGARENEGLTRLVADATDHWLWDRGLHVPELNDVFRGDLARLRATGEYTQDPDVVPGAFHFCDLAPPPGLTDADVPDPGQGFFYLPAATGTVEGTLGFDSAGVERERTLACTP